MRLILLYMTLYSSQLYAVDLVFAFGPGNGAPFAIVESGQLKGGLFKDMGEALAEKLGWDVAFRHAPTKRVSQLMMEGEINSVCLTHPDWIEDSQKLIWSTMIAQDFDHLVSLPQKRYSLSQVADLQGLTIGAMTGYIYFNSVMDFIAQGKAQRRDFNNLEALYASLWAQRIDVAVDSLISINYRKKFHNNHRSLQVSKLAVYRYDLYCAFSNELRPFQNEIRNGVAKMVKNGDFKSIIRRYK